MSGKDAEWDAFVAGHRQQLEDALLPTLAEAQSAGIVPDPAALAEATAKQLVTGYDDMRRQAAVRGINVSYPDGEPAPGTPMKLVSFASPIDGSEVQVPMPADPPAAGLRVLINGIEGIMYADPGGEVDEDEVEEAIARAVDVHAQQLKHDDGIGIYALAVKDELRDELIGAWDHYQDHQCQAGAMLLDRIVEQLIVVFLEAR